MRFPDTYRLFGLVPVPATWIGCPLVVRDIHNQTTGALYLRRVYLAPRVFLHRIAQPDGDRHLHNHPWVWAWSLILWGGYVEQRTKAGVEYLSSAYELRCGSRNLLRAGDYHRIRSVRPHTWTLFITGKRASSWGFWLPEAGHVDYRQYLQ